MKTTAEVIAEVVAAAPPLTDEQRARLATLLLPQPSTMAVRRLASTEARKAAA